MNTFFEYCYIQVQRFFLIKHVFTCLIKKTSVLAFILSTKALDIVLLFSYNFYKYVKDLKTLLYYKPKLCVYINMLYKFQFCLISLQGYVLNYFGFSKIVRKMFTFLSCISNLVSCLYYTVHCYCSCEKIKQNVFCTYICLHTMCG